MTFASKLRGFMGNPTTTFGAVKEDTASSALKYALICLLILGAAVGLILTLVLLVHWEIFFFYAQFLGGPPFRGFGSYDELHHAVRLLPIPISVGCSIAGGMIFIFVGGTLTHLLVYLLGGRQGHSYRQTLKALAYGATPVCVVGWVPFIGGVAGGIWAVVVTAIGLRELHGITTGRAVAVAAAGLTLVIIVPVIVLLLIILAPYST